MPPKNKETSSPLFTNLRNKMSAFYQALPINLSTITGWRYPGTPRLLGHPVLGRTKYVSGHNGLLKNALEACALAEKYQSEVCYYWMTHKCVIVSTNPYHIREMTKRDGPVSRREPFAFFQELGPMIFTDAFPQWRKKRDVYNKHVYFDEILQKYEQIMLALVEKHVNEVINQENFDLKRFCNNFAFELMLRTIIGVSEEKFDATKASFEPFVDKAIEDVFDLKNISKWMLPKLIRKMAYRDEITDPAEAAEKNREMLEKTLFKHNPELLENTKSFLKNLSEVSPSGISGDTISIFFAGKDSTVTAMPLIIKLLEAHPSVKSKLKAEIKEKIGNDPINAQTIEKLEYLKCIINEALRLYPPFPLMTRGVEKRFKLSNITLYPGDTIILATYYLQRRKKIWGEDAEQFKPERFEKLTVDQKAAFQPFGHGFQFCVGKKFVELELRLVIASLYSGKYEINIIGENDFSMELGTTLKPAKPTQCNIKTAHVPVPSKEPVIA